MSGKLGNLVIVPCEEGVILRERVTPANPRTDAQLAARYRQTKASQAWTALTEAQLDSWKAYAATLGMRPMNAYVSHAVRRLLVNPSVAPLQNPPTTAFFGDAISITASAGVGAVVFTASGPSASGIVAELLVQRLANRTRQSYVERYRFAAIAAFSAGNLSVPVLLPAGTYAVAYRFLKAETGQATALAEIGRVTV